MQSKVKVSPEIIERIDNLRVELEKELGYPFGQEDVIQMALTAFEDVRGG